MTTATFAKYFDIIASNPTSLISSAVKDGTSDEANNEVTNDLSALVKAFVDPIIEKDSKILDQIYVDGLDSNQVWEQSKIVIDNNIEKLMFNEIPAAKEVSGDYSSSDIEESDEDEELTYKEERDGDSEEKMDNSEHDYEQEDDSSKLEDTDNENEKNVDNEIQDEENSEDEKVIDESKSNNKKENGYGLNDEFFNLEKYQDQVLALEEKDDYLDSDEDDIDYFGDITDGSDAEVEYYDDFFDKPQSQAKDSTNKKSKKRSKDDGEFDDKEYDNAMKSTMLDLFDESDGEDKQDDGDFSDNNGKNSSEKNLSTFEKQQREIQRQIAELEKEAVEEKKWTMKGESSIKSRPTDALLDEELEFDRNAKPVPVITKEVTESIEELIRRRIKNYDFDDLPRRLFSDINKRLQKRDDFSFEELGKKSQKSLAEIYEDENFNGVTSETTKNEELEKKHNEIIELHQNLAYKLDSLCSLHFIPKPAGTNLEVKVNTSTIQMEDAQPVAMASETTLAPQEIYKSKNGVNDKNEITLSNGLIISRGEMSREEKKTLRNKRKRQNKEFNKKKSKKAKEGSALDVLKKSGAKVTVVDSRGTKKDLDGNAVRDNASHKSVSFKL